MIELVLAGDKISSGDRRPVPRLLKRRQLLFIHMVIGNDSAGESGVVLKIIRGHKRRQIVAIARRRRAILRRSTAGIDSFDKGFWDSVTVVANVILNASTVFANTVCPDDAAVLQMDDFRPGTTRRKRTYTSTYEEDDRCPH